MLKKKRINKPVACKDLKPNECCCTCMSSLAVCVIYGSRNEVTVPKILAIFYVAFLTFLPSRTGEHVAEMRVEPLAHLHSDWNVIGPLE